MITAPSRFFSRPAKQRRLYPESVVAAMLLCGGSPFRPRSGFQPTPGDIVARQCRFRTRLEIGSTRASQHVSSAPQFHRLSPLPAEAHRRRRSRGRRFTGGIVHASICMKPRTRFLRVPGDPIRAMEGLVNFLEGRILPTDPIGGGSRFGRQESQPCTNGNGFAVEPQA